MIVLKLLLGGKTLENGERTSVLLGDRRATDGRGGGEEGGSVMLQEGETASEEWGRGAFLRGRGAKREMAH